jgi:hypothetical protein
LREVGSLAPVVIGPNKLYCARTGIAERLRHAVVEKAGGFLQDFGKFAVWPDIVFMRHTVVSIDGTASLLRTKLSA